jgi:hypothetical protein
MTAEARELLHLAELGMQFSDTTRQKTIDVKRVFDHMVEHDITAIMGTEAGGAKSADLRAALRAEAPRAGFHIFLARGSDAWIAVDKSKVVGTPKDWYDPVLDASAGVGKHTGRGVFGVEVDTCTGEHITFLTSHYLTKGDLFHPEVLIRENRRLNRLLADAIATHAKMKGAGGNLVFYGGDQNTVDRESDTFFGHPLTSCWDELEVWPNTGHGNIDVIASYDHDTRVKCVDAWVSNDRKFKLNTDHWLVEAVFSIRPKKAKR